VNGYFFIVVLDKSTALWENVKTELVVSSESMGFGI
jgi:hypothetical protein